MLTVNSVTCSEMLDSASGLCTSFGTTKATKNGRDFWHMERDGAVWVSVT